MAIADIYGIVPNSYGSNTGNVMTFGNPAFEQPVGTPMGSALGGDDLSTIDPREIFLALGYGDGASTAVGGGVSDPGTNGAANIGIGPASGSPGAGGLGGMAGGITAALGFTNPVMGIISAVANAVLGRTPTAQEVMNVVNSVTGGGNVGGGQTGGASGMGVAPGSAEAQAQEAGLGTNESGQNTTGAGAGAGEDGGVASTGGEGGGPGPGIWKGGEVTKDKVRGPKPNKHDDGITGIKVGEYVINVKSAAKAGKDVLEKINSGDFDPAMLRFAVLRKVGK